MKPTENSTSGKLAGKVVLLTGASSGIGASTALELARQGAKVALAARRKDHLEALASGMDDALVLETDLSSAEAVRGMVKSVVGHYGRLDVLICNAARIIVSPAETATADDLESSMRVNLIAPVLAAQEAVAVMRRQGGGHIINVGSPGFMMGIPFYAPYVCSKAAMTAWTRTLQAEWAGTGIAVSEYFPGYIKTDSNPVSRVGEVGQDLLMAEKVNLISRLFTKPKTPEHVARQIARLIEKPRPLVCSGFGVQLGAYLSNIPGFRLAIATQMARNARAKLNIR